MVILCYTQYIVQLFMCVYIHRVKMSAGFTIAYNLEQTTIFPNIQC